MSKRITFTISSEQFGLVHERAVACGKTVEQLFQETLDFLLEELWLYDPANKELVAEIKQALREPATIDQGSFKKYV